MTVEQGALDLFGASSTDGDLEDAASPTYGVIEFADVLNGVLQQGFADGVWLRGEIEGLTNRRGHTYFNLVERNGDQQGSLSVSLFRGRQIRLEPVLAKHGLRLADGLKVRLFGTPDFFARFGRLSLIMSDIDPRFTLGDLAGERDRLLRQLDHEGLREANRRLHLPVVPLRIGLVTSKDTAAWHDFANELAMSRLGFAVRAFDTPVQGPGAVDSVARAIRSLGSADVDVIVVIRGGGARSDLAVFDSEPIARAIATSSVPVITGIGHEIDRSVSDDVAHTSLKTPTAAASFLVDRVSRFREDTEQMWVAIQASAAGIMERSTSALDRVARATAHRSVGALDRSDERLAARRARVVSSARHHLVGADRHLGRAADRLSTGPARSIDHQVAHVDRVAARIRSAADRGLRTADLQLAAVQARVTAADPVHLLRRGWTITRDGDGQIVRSTADIAPGSTIHTTTADGTLTSHVDSVQPAPTQQPIITPQER